MSRTMCVLDGSSIVLWDSLSRAECLGCGFPTATRVSVALLDRVPCLKGCQVYMPLIHDEDGCFLVL